MTDKLTNQYVLGSLMVNPNLLSQTDKYTLSPRDFTTTFERIIFQAIQGLHCGGASTIQPIDIDSYLTTDGAAHTLFQTNNGISYLQEILEYGSADNFDYYYQRLKKFNLLTDLERSGINIDEFYAKDYLMPNADKINERFESLTIKNITDTVHKKLLKVETDYAINDEIECIAAADGIDDFINEIHQTVDIGLPVQGEIYNEVINGAQRSCLTIRSGQSGIGKTRTAVADACYLAYPVRYEENQQQWVQTGSCERVLFIITEQTVVQIRKMILAYLTDMNESLLRYNLFTPEQEDRIQKALQIMKDYADNFLILKIPDPDIEIVKTLIREKVLTNNIGYVFYDYIFISPALLKQFHGFNLRNDELLLLLTTALKDLAVELNICLFTSTQVNAQADDNKNIRNEASLAGGRATINKADNGAIMARPTNDELELLGEIINRVGTPNMVTDIFKVRSGQWTQVRIWSIFDAGTLRKKDLFITDSRLEPIKDFGLGPKIDVTNWDDETKAQLLEYVKGLNQ